MASGIVSHAGNIQGACLAHFPVKCSLCCVYTELPTLFTIKCTSIIIFAVAFYIVTTLFKHIIASTSDEMFLSFFVQFAYEPAILYLQSWFCCVYTTAIHVKSWKTQNRWVSACSFHWIGCCTLICQWILLFDVTITYPAVEAYLLPATNTAQIDLAVAMHEVMPRTSYLDISVQHKMVFTWWWKHPF
jgi:hypothetical protein